MAKQGVRGPKPRPLIGNILDVASFVSQATSKDMDHITHDTVDRLLPHYVAWSRQYGKRFIFWNWGGAKAVYNRARIDQRASNEV
ncbi:hypothetical protein OIU84_028751 [Salix udensis]|uniref:Uncharacterized protein n=1 Tax=Salix udensis TaxID=889485 RepID=A0AAD6P9V2_9ROSI|nr:hypothetical protein OIU84_028751 [Salix udensis]